MKGRFFSKGIFWEHFRQLKIAGIIGAVLYTLFGVFVSVGINISETRLADLDYAGGSYSIYAEKISSTYLCTVQLLIPLIFVPLLMLASFHFLTKRNSSDFYHALLVKREAVYTGILAAVFAWAFIITALPLIVMWMVCLPLNGVDFAFAEALKAMLNTLVSCLFIMGVMALGINISGTLFTNIVSSGIVLVLPRFILVMCWMISGAMVANSVIDYHYVRLMVYGNPITKLIYILSSYDESAFARYFTSGLPAGAVEGLAYLLAGGVFFKLRKSESASMSSINRGVQSVIRHVLALVFSTIASVFLVECVWYGYTDEFEIFMAVLFYVLAFVVYFMYELITTRKWKSVAKSVRQLPFFVGMTAAIFAVISAISINGNSYRMDAENAEYIKVIAISRFWGAEYFLEDEDFPVEIESMELKKLIADAYNREADGTGSDTQIGDIAVAVRENGITRKRYVYLGESVFETLLGEIYSSLGIDVSEKLPEIKAGDSRYRIYLYWNIETPCELTAEETRKVYDTLRSEILESENPAGFFNEVRDKTVCTLGLSVNNGYGESGIELPISVKTPETFRLIQEIIAENKQSVSFDRLYEENFGNALDGVEVNGRISVYSDKYDKTVYYGITSADTGESAQNMLLPVYEILKKYNPDGDVSGKNVVVESSGWYNGEYKASFGVYNLSDEDMAKLWNIIAEYY